MTCGERVPPCREAELALALCIASQASEQNLEDELRLGLPTPSPPGSRASQQR